MEAACFGTDSWSAAQVAGALKRAGALYICDAGVGYVIGEQVAGEVELHRMGVLPEKRRSGLGRQLFRAFARVAAEAGGTRLFLEVREDNHPARALYASVGLTEVGRRPHYYRDGCAAIVLGFALPHGTQS